VLTAAVGAGAVLGSLSAALLVGRGALARWFGVGIALWGLPLAVIAVLVHAWVALLMLAIAGIGNALVDVGGFTLLARLAHDSVLARVCGAFEGIITLGVAAGALVTPLLITEFGTRAALAIVGVITPAAVLASWRSLRVLDRRMEVRDSDIALLQGVPMLRPLPEATIEQLAASLSYAQLPAGVAVFEQGDDGDVFYVIERGRANLFVDGEPVRALSSGEGFGEIALIGDRRRTASVCAATDLTLRGLERAVFVAAVAGYSQSAEAVHLVIDEHLDRFRPGAIPG
jgi:MFS family permease